MWIKCVAKADDTPDFCCRTFVVQLCCAKQKLLVCHTLLQSLQQAAQQKSEIRTSSISLQLVAQMVNADWSILFTFSCLHIDRSSDELFFTSEIFNLTTFAIMTFMTCYWMEWTDSKVHEFIDLWQTLPCLYDVKSEEYHTPGLKGPSVEDDERKVLYQRCLGHFECYRQSFRTTVLTLTLTL